MAVCPLLSNAEKHSPDCIKTLCALAIKENGEFKCCAIKEIAQNLQAIVEKNED